jgi:hypothetical protein
VQQQRQRKITKILECQNGRLVALTQKVEIVFVEPVENRVRHGPLQTQKPKAITGVAFSSVFSFLKTTELTKKSFSIFISQVNSGGAREGGELFAEFYFNFFTSLSHSNRVQTHFPCTVRACTLYN